MLREKVGWSVDAELVRIFREWSWQERLNVGRLVDRAMQTYVERRLTSQRLKVSDVSDELLTLFRQAKENDGLLIINDDGRELGYIAYREKPTAGESTEPARKE